MRGVKPTRKQKKQLQYVGLNSANWLVVRDNNEYMQIIHRNSSAERKIPKAILEAMK